MTDSARIEARRELHRDVEAALRKVLAWHDRGQLPADTATVLNEVCDALDQLLQLTSRDVKDAIHEAGAR